MTNNQQEISPSQQTEWFQKTYTQQNPQSYWVWLIKESKETIIGYFAAKRTDQGIYITEGISKDKRGMGVGSFALDFMLSKKLTTKIPIFADIFNSNSSSIRLHRKFGFKEHSKINDQISRFILFR